MSKMTMSHEKRKEHHSLNPPFTNGGGKGVGGGWGYGVFKILNNGEGVEKKLI